MKLKDLFKNMPEEYNAILREQYLKTYGTDDEEAYKINNTHPDSALAIQILKDFDESKDAERVTFEEYKERRENMKFSDFETSGSELFGTAEKTMSFFGTKITEDGRPTWLANWIFRLHNMLKIRPKFQNLFIDNPVNCRKALALNSIRTNMMVIESAETAEFLKCYSHFEDIRGVKYSLMSFSERYEVLKEATNTFLITVRGLEHCHNWLLDGYECSSIIDETMNDEKFRIRSVKLEHYNQDNQFEKSDENSLVAITDNDNMRVIIKLSSSPKDNYSQSRYRLMFGPNSTLGVQFSFPRMGARTQLYYKNNPDFVRIEPAVYPKLVNNFIEINSKQTELSKDAQYRSSVQTKIERIQNEKQGYTAMKHFLDKPLWIAGCKFEQLCQNTSGMHSYKYTYYSSHASNFQVEVDEVKKWAIPYGLNSDLYEPEQSLKYSLRLSLLNTPVIPTISVPECTIIEDVIGDEGNFTDGCGFISLELAKQVTHLIKQNAKSKSPQTDSQRYQPNHNTGYEENTNVNSVDDIISAFQIRYKGAKGMLLVNPGVTGLVLRKSMVKFKQDDSEDNSKLFIVGHSSPASLANINTTIMHLLSGCSNNQKFEDRILHLWDNFVEETIEDYSQEKILKQLISDGDYKGLNVIGMTKDKHLSFLAGPFRSKLSQLKLPVSNSRRLYGVSDPFGILKEDEVFVSVTIGSNISVLEQDIVITKEPCLHRGDLRKIKSVRKKELEYLRDVIVFPIVGKRPISNMITGSDLDGDKYFVCWDSEIVDNVQQFEPGVFDIEMDKDHSRDFDPDVFKSWVGIRHAYACYFGSSWTSDGNWKIMERLSEIVNIAVDAPKKGKTFQAISEQDIEIIDNFPGYPHYHPEKTRSGVRHSISIIGKMFDRMIEKITYKMGFEPVNYNILITPLDDREYITISNMFHICSGDSSAHLASNKMMMFLNDHLNSINEKNETIQFTSEFLNIYWRTLCFLSYKYKYVYIWKLSQATENTHLSESLLCSMSSIIRDEESCLITVQGLLNSRITCNYEELENSLIKIELNQESFKFILSLFYNACSRIQFDLGFNLVEKAKSLPRLAKKKRNTEVTDRRLKWAILRAFSDNADDGEMYIMWLLYKNGHKFPLDLEMAYTWLMKTRLSLRAKEGVLNFKSTTKDTSIRGYLQRKSRCGFAESQYNLGRLYYLIDKNLMSALYWLKKSAQQYLFEPSPEFVLSTLKEEMPDPDNVTSVSMMFNIAQMYEVGDRFERNICKACYWYERCAFLGVTLCGNSNQVCKGEYCAVIPDQFNIDQLIDDPLDILDDPVIIEENIQLEPSSGPFSGSYIISNEIGQKILSGHTDKLWNIVYRAGETDSITELRKEFTKYHLTAATMEIFLFFKTSEGEVFGYFTDRNWALKSIIARKGYSSVNSKIYKIDNEIVHVFPRKLDYESPVLRFPCDFLNGDDIMIPSGFLLHESNIDLGFSFVIPQELRTKKKIFIDELEVFVSPNTITTCELSYQNSVNQNIH